MVRCIGIALLMGCLTTHLAAQAPTMPPPGAQDGAARADQTSAEAAGPVTPVASTEFPLDAFKNFSAVMVGSIMEMGDGKVESHIYRSGDLMRMEGVEEHGYLITDLSTLVTYGVSAGPCMRDDHPFFRASPFAAMRPGYKVERMPGGKETVDGHSVQIEDVTVISPEPGKSLKLRLWEADDLQGFPIRIDFLRPSGRNSTIRYKNIFLGPQDPTLFIHPKVCGSLPQRATAKKRRSGAHKKPATTPASN